MECLVYSGRKCPSFEKGEEVTSIFTHIQLGYFQGNTYIRPRDNNKLLWHMIHMYIHDTLIPKVLEGMSNGKNKAKLLENYGLTNLCQYKVGEWLTKIIFK